MLKLKLNSDGAMKRAIEKALKNGKVTTKEVRGIIRASLDGDSVTEAELRDLLRLKDDWDVNLGVAGQKLIEGFVAFVVHLNATFEKPALKWSGISDELEKKVFDFIDRPGRGKYKHITRQEVGLGLLAHLADPDLINQGRYGFCGPVVVLHDYASRHRAEYARFVIDLYERGRAHLGKLLVVGDDSLRDRQPNRRKMLAINWMTLATLRASAPFAEYASPNDKAASNMYDMEEWLRDIGYQDIRGRWVADSQPEAKAAAAQEADLLFDRHYSVFLMVSWHMFENPVTQGPAAKHWIALKSKIAGLGGAGGVWFKCYSYGKGDRRVPEGKGLLPHEQFLDYFYCYLAAKPV